jgi:uncharacterized protein YaiE (UPF0345 family)
MFEWSAYETLGVIAPCDSSVERVHHFGTNTSDVSKLLAVECVQDRATKTFSYYRAGQSFVVEGNSSFNLRTEEIVQCDHARLEG